MTSTRPLKNFVWMIRGSFLRAGRSKMTAQWRRICKLKRMMPQAPLKVAVVGCGWVSDWHVRDGFAHLPHQFSLVACCDSNEERLNQFGDRYGVARRTTR